MQFSSLVSIAAFVAAVSANTIEFINQDSLTRTVIFTPSAGMAKIHSVTLGAGSLNTTSVDFPTGWIGNWYSVTKGTKDVPGMLGEIAWNGWGGNHYYDVSAIVNPDDHSGVKMMFPKKSLKPMSGCQTFPCDNAYNLPDDIQTLSTTESTIVCLLGTKSSSSSSKTYRRHAREFITGTHEE